MTATYRAINEDDKTVDSFFKKVKRVHLHKIKGLCHFCQFDRELSWPIKGISSL
jgi:hypothetical protein